MNIARTKLDAAAAAPHRAVTLGRRLVVCCLIGAAAMSAAIAGPPGSRGQGQSMERAQPRQYDDRAARQFDDREFQARADEQRRQLQMQQEQAAQNEAFRRSGRLTPDERRDLRRQINEAGNEIYSNRRRR